MKKCEAVVAGAFYPGNAAELRRMLGRLIEPDRDKSAAVALIAPHAGYVYSGAVAGAVYSSAILPERFILLGPSHRGIDGKPAIWGGGVWSTPLGEIAIDERLAASIMSKTELVIDNAASHLSEHALEVQVPFIQYLKPESRIVPINIPYFAGYDDLTVLGEALADAIQACPHPVLIVASTDMSHQVSQQTARIKDFLAIDEILNLNAKGLYEVVARERISMCGFQAVTAALTAARKLKANRAELIRYRTSGDVTGDTRNVVGYAGIRISE